MNRLILSSGTIRRARSLLLSLVLSSAPTVLCQNSNSAPLVQPRFSDVTSDLGVHFQHRPAYFAQISDRDDGLGRGAV